MSGWFYPGLPYPSLGPYLLSLGVVVTDCDVLSEIQRVTLEHSGDGGVTWPSGMWTAAEVLGYLNQRQNRFLAATCLFWTRLETNIVVGQNDQAAPADWVATVFIAYKSGAGLYRELPKLDALELDFRVPSWPGSTAATPRGYIEIDGPTLTTQVVPAPTDAGSALERYYVALTTQPGGVCTPLVVSDEFLPTLKYGVLADMFNKVGPAHNVILAQACEERWQEGLEAATLTAQEGWFAL